jgi:hypothetical protein
MIKEEVYAHCGNCVKLDMCADALSDVIWTTHISSKVVNCEYFPELGGAIKEYIQGRIHERLMKSMEETGK